MGAGSSRKEHHLDPETLQLARMTGVLTIKNKDLRALPEDLMSGECDWLKTLDISDNDIQELPQNPSLTWPNVREIDVSNNELSQLHGLSKSEENILEGSADLDGDLPEGLEILHASGNALTKMPHVTGLTNLQELTLSSNRITSVCDKLPPSLEELNLERNNISTLTGAAIADLSSLRVLNLHGNSLTSIPPAIRELTSLRVLKLGGNRFENSLPDEISSLPFLEEVELRSCQLTRVPQALGFCKALKVVDLSNNSILCALVLEKSTGENPVRSSIGVSDDEEAYSRIEDGGRDPSMAALQNVEELILDYDNFSAFASKQSTTLPPPAISPAVLWVRSVTRLSLRGMGLTTEALSAELFQLMSLTALNLADNKLKDLPDDIENLTSLRSLFLSGNKLLAVPAGVCRMAMLDTLDVSNNGMVYLPPAMGGMQSLRCLHIDHNKIAGLPFELGDVTSLEEVTFVKCPIEEPPAHMFGLGMKIVLEYMRNRKRRSNHLMASTLAKVTGQSTAEIMDDWSGELEPNSDSDRVRNIRFPSVKMASNTPRFPSAENIKPPGALSRWKANLTAMFHRGSTLDDGLSDESESDGSVE